MAIKGVITGDIINSRKISDELRNRFLDIIQNLGDKLSYLSLGNIQSEIYRGDSFQILIEDVSESLKIAVLLRSKLREYDLDARLAIGIGNISFNNSSVVTSDGEAYINSGKCFDSIGKNRLVILTPWDEVNEELKVSTAFADNIISKWTPTQSKVMFISISEDNIQKEIAYKMGKSVQNINKILMTARESLIKDYLNRYTQLISNITK
ncbi:MAG: SatD family protein [Bacteroidales bacterium]